MGNYFKSALRIFVDYCTVLIMFIVFLVSVLGFAKDNQVFWISIYSLVMFSILTLIIYSDMKKLAVKEKRPQYNLNPYPLKGFVLGLIGFLPFILLQIIYPLIDKSGNIGPFPRERVMSLSLSTLLGPVYFAIRLGGKTLLAHILASSLVPLLAMLGYMAGFYGFELKKRTGGQQGSTPNNKK